MGWTTAGHFSSLGLFPRIDLTAELPACQLSDGAWFAATIGGGASSTLRRTVIGPRSGSDNASASTAAHSADESLRQRSIETSAADRRHTPAISPLTSTAPGHTRVVHRWARRSGSGTRISLS